MTRQYGFSDHKSSVRACVNIHKRRREGWTWEEIGTVYGRSGGWAHYWFHKVLPRLELVYAQHLALFGVSE